MKETKLAILLITFCSILFSDVTKIENSFKTKIDSLHVIKKKFPERAIRYARRLLAENSLKENHSYKYQVLNILGGIYLDLGFNTEALSYFIDADEQSKLIGREKDPWVQINIGNVYMHQGKYIEAKENFLDALEIFESGGYDHIKTKKDQALVLSDLGWAEIKLKNFDKALSYFESALNTAREDPQYQIFIKLPQKLNINVIKMVRAVACQHYSLSHLYRLLGKFDLALDECNAVDSLLNTVLRTKQYNESIQKHTDDIIYKLHGNNHSEKTRLYTIIGDYEAALIQTRTASQILTNWPKDFAKHMKVEAEYYIKKDDLYLALESIDRGLKVCVLNGLAMKELELLYKKMEILKSHRLDRSALDIAERIVQKNKIFQEKKVNSLVNSMEYKSRLMKNRERLKNLKTRDQFYLSIGVFCFIILGMVAVVYRYRKQYFVQKTMVRDHKNKIVEIELKNKENELINMSENIYSKNNLLNSIINIFEYQIPQIKNENDKKRITFIKKKIQNQIDNSEDWEEFQIQFSSLYPEFINYLNIQYPDLNKADIKLCCYLKLKMNTKEIARCTGSSLRSIENKRYRLRKKLELKTETSLESFISSLKC